MAWVWTVSGREGPRPGDGIRHVTYRFNQAGACCQHASGITAPAAVCLVTDRCSIAWAMPWILFCSSDNEGQGLAK